MPDSQQIIRVLEQGAEAAVVWVGIAFLLSRFLKDIFGRCLLVISLIVTTAIYVVFAIRAGASGIWVLVEVAQVVAFGTMGLLSLRGSQWWLVAGWALHPLWDVGVHYIGPGRSFAPWTYAIACVSFDQVVAAYVTIAYEVVGRRRLGFRDIAA
jgi:hypothetical protein